MAIDVSGWQWGPDNQFAYDPTLKKYFMGSFDTSANPGTFRTVSNDGMNYEQISNGDATDAVSNPWTTKGYFAPGDTQYWTQPLQNNAYKNSAVFGGSMPQWKTDSYGADAFTGIDKLSPELQKMFTGGQGNLNVTGWDQLYGAPVGHVLTSQGNGGLFSEFKDAVASGGEAFNDMPWYGKLFTAIAGGAALAGAGAGAGALGGVEGAGALGGSLTGDALGGSLTGGALGGGAGFDLTGLEGYNGTTDLAGGATSGAGNLGTDLSGLQGYNGTTDLGGASGTGDLGYSSTGIDNNISGVDASGNYSTAGNLQNQIGNIYNQIMNGNAPPGAGSALQRILSGNGTTEDYLSLGLKALPGLLSAGGNLLMAGKQNQLSQQFLNQGAPYRDQLANISANPSAYFNSPAAQEMFNQVSRKFGVGGNPAGDPFKQAQIMGALAGNYGNERQLLGSLGGLGSMTQAGAQMAGQGLQTQAQAISNVGSAISNITNPQTVGTIEQLLASIKAIQGMSGGAGANGLA